MSDDIHLTVGAEWRIARIAGEFGLPEQTVRYLLHLDREELVARMPDTALYSFIGECALNAYPTAATSGPYNTPLPPEVN